MADPVVTVDKVTKHYASVVAVDEVSFNVNQGTICALLGGNGAGKTTTISMLLGLLLPTSGQVKVFGKDMRTDRYRALPRMNFSSPYVDLPMRLSVRENLIIYAHLYGLKKPKLRISTLSDELELSGFLDRPYGTLSAGQKTRVALAKALLNKPELMLLDEPTASLDPDTADRIRGYLVSYQKETGATLLLASHNMLEVERICTDVLMLRQGQIVDRGTPGDLISRYGRRSMEEVFLDIARNSKSDGAAAV